MTRQQKIEAQLQKEIRKLEREKFALTRENDRLKYEIKVLTAQNRTLDGDLSAAARRMNEAEKKTQKVLDEVHRYATTDVWTYLEQKTKKL